MNEMNVFPGEARASPKKKVQGKGNEIKINAKNATVIATTRPSMCVCVCTCACVCVNKMTTLNSYRNNHIKNT